MNQKIVMISDIDVPYANLPICICIYKNNDESYMMVEVNTGSHKGSIKPISKSYRSILELTRNFNIRDAQYRFLQKFIIYNQKQSRMYE